MTTVALLLLCCREAQALDPTRTITQYVHDVWTSKQGLPPGGVFVVTQTTDGYLWMGGAEGLVEFDGLRFRIFDSTNTPTLKVSHVQALYRARDGTLWIGTWGGGLSRRREHARNIEAFEGRLSDEHVSSICEDGSGNLWVGTQGGLNRLGRGDRRSYTIIDGLPSDTVTALFCDEHSHSLWIGTSRGLTRLRYGSARTDSDIEALAHTRITALQVDEAGDLWAGSTEGLAEYHSGRLRLFTVKDGLLSNTVSRLYREVNGTLWIGTDRGLNRYRDGAFLGFAPSNGLSEKHVWSLYEDREGSLWIGTFLGVERLREGSFITYSSQEGLSDDNVWAVYEDSNKDVWVGTDLGLNRIRGRTIVRVGTIPGIPQQAVLGFHEDTRGNLWIGTRSGVRRLHGGTVTGESEFEHWNGRVAAIVGDGQSGLWIGLDEALARFVDGKVTTYSNRDRASSSAILVLHQDVGGRLWIGTNGGGLIMLKDGAFFPFTQKDGLAGDVVGALYEDPEGTLWLGTSAGLNRLRDGKLTGFSGDGGLPRRAIFSILEDDFGNLWLSGDHGVCRVKKELLEKFASNRSIPLKPVCYGTPDGMKSQECNGSGNNAGMKSHDGRLWFATNKGVAVVDPGHLEINRRAPPVEIEEVNINDREFDPSMFADVPSGKGKLQITFNSLSLVAAEKNQFKYKLEGFDDDWVSAGTRREAHYTNLPPGRYRFHVIGSNSDGVWNDVGTSFSFQLRPAAYQTWWFRGLLLGAFIVGLAGVYVLRVRQLKLREVQLTTLVNERTLELAKTNQDLADVVAKLEELSFRDGLTGVANRRRLDAVLQTEWQRSSRSGLPLSLILIDVDYFKKFNDAHGHQRADECLRRIAGALCGVAQRPGDLVARYGGEEFAVVLPNTEADGAQAVAANLRASVVALAIPHQASEVSKFVTVSLGVATAKAIDGAQPNQLVEAADRALYDAKRAGRNRIASNAAPRRELVK